MAIRPYLIKGEKQNNGEEDKEGEKLGENNRKKLKIN